MKKILFSVFYIILFQALAQNQTYFSEELVLDVDDYSFHAQIIGVDSVSNVEIISSNTTFPDQTYTDINGNIINVYDELNQGKTVLLTFFNHFSTICQQEVPFLNHLYQVFDVNENKTTQIAFECNSNSNLTSLGGLNNLYGDWGIQYPIVNLNGFLMSSPDPVTAFLSNITEQTVPSYIIISPDKTYTIVSGVISTNEVLSEVTQEILKSQGINQDDDLAFYDIEHDRCDDNTNVFINVQNTGLNTINGFQIQFYDMNDSLFETVTLPYVLEPMFRSEVGVFFNSAIDSSFTVKVEISSLTECSLNNIQEVDYQSNAFLVSNQINIEIKTDDYPQEIAWILRDHTLGIVVDSAGLNSNGTIVGIPEGVNNYSPSLDVNHCYTFQIYDKLGDGICCNNGDGYYKIFDAQTGGLIDEGGSYLNSAKSHFKAVDNLSTDSFENTSSVFKPIKKVEYFDILGRLITQPIPNTITIKKTTYEDDTFSAEKIHVKFVE